MVNSPKINNKNLEKQKAAYEQLSAETRAILLGLVLGDGSLRIALGYINARMSFCHSKLQEEYIMWKRKKLAPELSAGQDIWLQRAEDVKGYSKNDRWRYQSGARASLTYLYKLTHKGTVGQEATIDSKPVEIRRTWLNLMTELSIAVWWCEDGSIMSGAQGVFCTDGFQEDQVYILDQYMKKVWGITTSVQRQNKKRKNGEWRCRLYLATHEDLRKLLLLIMPHIPTLGMLYKVMLLYAEPELQQRWISEIVSRTKFTREEAEKVCMERKERLAKFKEMGVPEAEESASGDDH